MSFELRTVFNSKLKIQNSKFKTPYQLPITNCQLSTINCQLSTVNYCEFTNHPIANRKSQSRSPADLP
ncbi:MAG: hypothetical protein HC942_05290 [Microcoleus sp. SU_5_6]|nr:hypothetical protein [Microcoleus sp. SU_5_6]NJL69203.1 hypothetical protein [Microcoleus sp. SM1_3_4]